jgi:hypothetical protein
MSVKAMKSGAVEFLTKPFRDQDLIDAIQQALKRDGEAKRQQKITGLKERYAKLIAREREVMVLIVSGMTPVLGRAIFSFGKHATFHSGLNPELSSRPFLVGLGAKHDMVQIGRACRRRTPMSKDSRADSVTSDRCRQVLAPCSQCTENRILPLGLGLTMASPHAHIQITERVCERLNGHLHVHELGDRLWLWVLSFIAKAGQLLPNLG